jgi:hypothetical protein
MDGGTNKRLVRFQHIVNVFRFFRFSSRTCQNKQGPLFLPWGLGSADRFYWSLRNIYMENLSLADNQLFVLFCWIFILKTASAFMDVTTHAAIHGWSVAVNKDDVSNRCCLVSKLYRRNWPTELENFLPHFRRRWQVSFSHDYTHKG